MELDGWRKALAHCRSCHCFPVSLKWNTLVLFIICYSIMNVWKLERAAVIYLQGIRGESCALKVGASHAAIRVQKGFVGNTLWNKTLSHLLKMAAFTISANRTRVLFYWFNSLYSVCKNTMKYCLASVCVTNKACKSWCIMARAALCLIFFLMV